MPRSSSDESESSNSSVFSSTDVSVVSQPRWHTLFSSDSDSDDSNHVDRVPNAVPAKDITYDGHHFLAKIDQSCRAEVVGIGKDVWEALEARDKDPSSLIEVLQFVLAPLVQYICDNYAVEYKKKPRRLSLTILSWPASWFLFCLVLTACLRLSGTMRPLLISWCLILFRCSSSKRFL